jgi:hypothetical protein
MPEMDSLWDDMILDIREVAAEMVADMRPLFDVQLRQQRMTTFLKKLDGEGLDKFLRRCGHKYAGTCDCTACGSFATMILGNS